MKRRKKSLTLKLLFAKTVLSESPEQNKENEDETYDDDNNASCTCGNNGSLF